LAFEIAERFSSTREAEAAANHFEQVHQKGGIPSDLAEVELADSRVVNGKISSRTLAALLRKAGMVKSGSEAWRKLSEGAVRLNGIKVHCRRPSSPGSESWFDLKIEGNNILSLGKRKFARIIIREENRFERDGGRSV